MPWSVIASLIIEVGYPMAMKIWQNVQAGGNATEAQWAELQALSKLTAQDEMRAQLVAAGVDLNSAQAIALLNLAK